MKCRIWEWHAVLWSVGYGNANGITTKGGNKKVVLELLGSYSPLFFPIISLSPFHAHFRSEKEKMAKQYTDESFSEEVFTF